MNLTERIREMLKTSEPYAVDEFKHERDLYEAAYNARGRYLDAARADFAAALKQVRFLSGVLEMHFHRARLDECGPPSKKTNGPMTQKILVVSRERAARLVPGVKYDSTGYVGDFAWGDDWVEVWVEPDKASQPEKREDW